MITCNDITKTLPNGILENSTFSPENGGVALHMSGFYTLGELLAIIEDMKHVDSVYRATK